MDYLITAITVVIVMAWNMLLTFLTYGLAVVVLTLAFCIIFFPLFWPLENLLSHVPRKYERLFAIYEKIKGKSEKICFGFAIFSAVLAAPILYIGGPGTKDIVHERIRAGQNHKVIVGDEIRRYKLVSLSSPKHVYAVFADESANITYKNVYVGTYCPGSSKRIGESYNIRVTRYYMSDNPEKMFIRFNDLPRVFCE
jgi:hypothetical protein